MVNVSGLERVKPVMILIFPRHDFYITKIFALNFGVLFYTSTFYTFGISVNARL
jgi:hypothetical protein